MTVRVDVSQSMATSPLIILLHWLWQYASIIHLLRLLDRFSISALPGSLIPNTSNCHGDEIHTSVFSKDIADIVVLRFAAVPGIFPLHTHPSNVSTTINLHGRCTNFPASILSRMSSPIKSEISFVWCMSINPMFNYCSSVVDDPV